MRIFWLITLLITTTAAFGAEKLNLQQCIEIALEKNPEMSIANKQLKLYKLGIQKSYGGTKLAPGVLPYISFGTNFDKSTTGKTDVKKIPIDGEEITVGDKITKRDYYNLRVGLSQNIYNGGKIRKSIQLAKNNYKNALIERDRSLQLLIADVTEKFYLVLKDQELLKVYSKSLENSREQLKKTRELHRIGQVAKKDLFKAQVREGNDRLNVIQQRSMLKSAISNLNVAMGRAPDQTLDVYEKEYKNPEYIGKQEAFNYALGNNKTLRSLKAQKESSFLLYKIAKGDWYPALSSTFSYSRENSDFYKAFGEINKHWSYSLGLSLSLPIFDGFRRKTNIQQRLIDYKIYDDQINKQKIDIQNQVQYLLLALETYKEMIEINELNIKSAKEDLRLAQEMYRLNSATLLEVLDAQVTLTRAQGDLITTKYDAKIAEAQLALVMGTL